MTRTSIADYKVTRRLSNEEELYLARSPKGARCHVLLLDRPRSMSDSTLDQVRLEIAACSKLDHPAVGKVLDLFETEGQLAVVGEPIDGIALDQLLARLMQGGAVDPAAVWHVGHQLAGALAQAHAAHEDGDNPALCHGHLSPRRIAVAWNGFVRLDGLGLSPLVSEKALEAEDDYAPPEQREGGRVTPRGDLYALASVLWSLLAGRRPDAVTPPVMTDIALEIPALVRELLTRCLEPSLGKRRVTSVEVEQALADVAGGAAKRSLAEAVAVLRKGGALLPSAESMSGRAAITRSSSAPPKTKSRPSMRRVPPIRSRQSTLVGSNSTTGPTGASAARPGASPVPPARGKLDSRPAIDWDAATKAVSTPGSSSLSDELTWGGDDDDATQIVDHAPGAHAARRDRAAAPSDDDFDRRRTAPRMPAFDDDDAATAIVDPDGVRTVMHAAARAQDGAAARPAGRASDPDAEARSSRPSLPGMRRRAPSTPEARGAARGRAPDPADDDSELPGEIPLEAVVDGSTASGGDEDEAIFDDVQVTERVVRRTQPYDGRLAPRAGDGDRQTHPYPGAPATERAEARGAVTSDAEIAFDTAESLELDDELDDQAAFDDAEPSSLPQPSFTPQPSPSPGESDAVRHGSPSPVERSSPPAAAAPAPRVTPPPLAAGSGEVASPLPRTANAAYPAAAPAPVPAARAASPTGSPWTGVELDDDELRMRKPLRVPMFIAVTVAAALVTVAIGVWWTRRDSSVERPPLDPSVRSAASSPSATQVASAKPSAKTAPAPSSTATTSASAGSSAVPDDGKDGTDLPVTMGYLLVRHSGKEGAQVFFGDRAIGPVNEKLRVVCGPHFVRVGVGRPPQVEWLGPGVPGVMVKCRGVTEMAAPLK
jgi:hypothetical protein